MADDFRMGLTELLRKAGMETDVDLLPEGVRVLALELMEFEMSQKVGADRYTGAGQRNGTREKQWDTRVGTIELTVSRVRDNGYSQSCL